VGLNDSYWSVMHGKENVKLVLSLPGVANQSDSRKCTKREFIGI